WAPAFGLAAAAALVLAAAAAIANLEVRYDADGFVVRTGRGAAVAAPGSDPAADVTVASVAKDTATTPAVAYVTAADLAAFEARLRDTFSAPSTSGLAQVAVASTTPQLSGDIRRLIEESE